VKKEGRKAKAPSDAKPRRTEGAETAERQEPTNERLGLPVFLPDFSFPVLVGKVYLVGFRKRPAETADGAAKAAADLGQALGAEHHKAKNKDEQDLLSTKTEHAEPPKKTLGCPCSIRDKGGEGQAQAHRQKKPHKG